MLGNNLFNLGALIIFVVVILSLSQSGLLKNARDEVDLTSEDIGVDTETSEVHSSPSPTVSPRVSSSPNPVQSIAPSTLGSTGNNSVPLDDFIFPGSTIVNKTNVTLSLSSNKSSDEITNWYKEKIKSLNFNVNSNVTTQTNGNVLNKLSAAKINLKVNIEIRKSTNDKNVSIVVSKD
ncbi:hypothetical protein HYS91_00210 [Candidatus Daviesbacteria bacterium]|nr:hypothetical protein [Candidatus Daviesbacteria bacterium]